MINERSLDKKPLLHVVLPFTYIKKGRECPALKILL
jgi:hypothetical protein